MAFFSSSFWVPKRGEEIWVFFFSFFLLFALFFGFVFDTVGVGSIVYGVGKRDW